MHNCHRTSLDSKECSCIRHHHIDVQTELEKEVGESAIYSCYICIQTGICVYVHRYVRGDISNWYLRLFEIAYCHFWHWTPFQTFARIAHLVTFHFIATQFRWTLFLGVCSIGNKISFTLQSVSIYAGNIRKRSYQFCRQTPLRLVVLRTFVRFAYKAKGVSVS